MAGSIRWEKNAIEVLKKLIDRVRPDKRKGLWNKQIVREFFIIIVETNIEKLFQVNIRAFT